jgi:hypothetical protein
MIPQEDHWVENREVNNNPGNISDVQEKNNLTEVSLRKMLK